MAGEPAVSRDDDPMAAAPEANPLLSEAQNVAADSELVKGSVLAGRPLCLWCGKQFTPRRDGGKRQVFCREACRRAFDAAGRRWVGEAIASAC